MHTQYGLNNENVYTIIDIVNASIYWKDKE